MGCCASSFPKYCDQPSTSCVRGGLKKYFGAPIYDEYEDDYWDGMPKETIWEPVSPGLNRERDKVSEFITSPDNLNLGAPYQGKVFCLLNLVEGDDCALAEANPKDEFLAYMNYISSSTLNPLSTQGLPWCNIF